MELNSLDADGNGEVDYDEENDILFFKIKNREYAKSIELNDLVLDVDAEGFVTGLQIFDASKLFHLDPESLQDVQRWEFHIKVENKVVSVQLTFDLQKDNKIIERGQNLVRESALLEHNSEVLCAMEV